MSELPDEVTNALEISFPRPIAGYLMNALFEPPSMRGVIYCDTKSGYSDGTTMLTAAVVDFVKYEGLSMVRTVDGGIYVIARNAVHRVRLNLHGSTADSTVEQDDL